VDGHQEEADSLQEALHSHESFDTVREVTACRITCRPTTERSLRTRPAVIQARKINSFSYEGKKDLGMWIGFIGLKIGTGGELL
jgi:hypothetical protein